MQAGLNNQLQRRFGIAPLTFKADGFLAFGIEDAFVQFQILSQFGFCYRTKLITRQGADRLAQWPHIDLTAQAIARCRSAVQVTARHLNFSRLLRAQRRVAAFKLQRHALGQKILDQKLIQLRLAIPEIEHQLPAPGRCFASQLQWVLIQTRGIRRPDKLAADLFVRTAHFNADRLRLDRVAVTVAQQGIEQYGFTGTIQIPWAKHKELQRVRLRATNIELGQVQRCRIQTQQAGLITLTRHQHFGLGWQGQLRVTVLGGFTLTKHLAFAVEQLQLDTGQGAAAFQRLGEDIQALLVAMDGKANVAEGEQGRRGRIAITARRSHHRQIHPRLLQRLDPGSRQDQGFTGITRRVQVKASAVHQIGHVQQVLGFVALQAAVATPLAKKCRQ